MEKIMTKEVETSLIVPQIWSEKWYDTLLAELPFASLISTDYEGEIAAVGDTVKISTMSEFSDAEIVGEADRSDTDLVSLSQQSLLINKMVVKDFMVTNRALLQSLAFVEKMKGMAVYAINKKIQAEIISLIVPSAAAPDHQASYAVGTTLALSDILDAKEALDAQNVPIADRHMILGSAQLNDIFNITQLTSSDFIRDGSPISSGQLPGHIAGFLPGFTTVVGNVAYFFHGSFMTMANQKALGVKEYDQGGTGLRGNRVNTDTLLGIKQLDGLRAYTKS